MKKTCFMCGDKIEINATEYRIIEIQEKFCLVIQLQTTKMRTSYYPIEEMERWIETGKVQLIPEEWQEEQGIEWKTLSEQAEKLFQKIKDVIREFQEYSISWGWLREAKERALLIQEVAEKYKMHVTTVRRYLRKYLQSGMSLRALIPAFAHCGGFGKAKQFRTNKKSGRKGISKVSRTEEVVEQFDAMVKRYIHSKTRMSFRALYRELLMQYYSEVRVINGQSEFVIFPEVDCPTQKQLYYWIKKKVSSVESYIAKHGLRKAENTIRPLYSDTINNLPQRGIGVRYEMDETEMDFVIVSRMDRRKILGRPIVYYIVDVFSKMIVGFGIGLDNNAWKGAESALLNMAEDKVGFCKKHGIEIKEEEWPVSRCLPQEIEVDNGSEYISNKFMEYGNENGIKIAFVRPAMGSMKPNVEQKFHQMNALLKGELPGEIQKDAYGQPHLGKANLDIEQMTKIVIEFILCYNKTPLENYPLTKEMYQAGIDVTPISIWNYSIYQNNNLKRITDMEQYKLSLLYKGTAQITREGICFKKKKYTCMDKMWLSKEMSKAKLDGKIKIPVRYDSHDLEELYFERDGKWYRAWSNERKTSNELYMDLISPEIELIEEEQKVQQNKNRRERLQQEINAVSNIRGIVKEHKKTYIKKKDRKNIEENRRIENAQLHQENRIEIQTETRPERAGTEESIPEKEYSTKQVKKQSSETSLFELIRSMERLELGGDSL
ncbi:MAG: transposase family protein [Faecalimonas sp.]|nr:transposase family protein [Faecalimonas sp.]